MRRWDTNGSKSFGLSKHSSESEANVWMAVLYNDRKQGRHSQVWGLTSGYSQTLIRVVEGAKWQLDDRLPKFNRSGSRKDTALRTVGFRKTAELTTCISRSDLVQPRSELTKRSAPWMMTSVDDITTWPNMTCNGGSQSVVILNTQEPALIFRHQLIGGRIDQTVFTDP